MGALARQLAALLLAVLALLVPGAEAGAQPVTVLSAQAPSQDVSAASLAWVDAEGRATVEELAAKRPVTLFTASAADSVYTLGHQSALWQRYRFARGPDTPQDWVIEFSQPLLDRVTVYQSTPSGSWTSQTAGDHVAVSSWPEPARFAQFALRLPDAGVRDVYVRVQNVTPLSLPVRVSTRAAQNERLQMDYLAIGTVFGGLLLLIVACLVLGRLHHDAAYSWYGLYACIMSLVIAALTGVAGQVLWRHSHVWNDLAPGVLSTLGGGAALLVIQHLCGSSPRQKRFQMLAQGLGFAALPVALAYALADRDAGVPLVGLYLSTMVGLGLGWAWQTWRRGDVIGLWVLAAFAPLAGATLLILGSSLGLTHSWWFSQYVLMAGLAVEVPMLLVALNLRSRERHSMQAREQALSSHDALTGLLAAHIFQDRLKQVVLRARRHRESAAVVYIDLVNYRYIKKTWGAAVAEQSLLRSVIKLRRILRDVETIGRVDEARFGLILEGVSSRTPVTEIAARLIAAGLMPLKGLKPAVILQFHVAGALLSEHAVSDTEISQALTDLVQGMSARSRRPIRFLEPEMTRPAPLGGDSVPTRPGRDEAPASPRAAATQGA
ncbi:MAG: hypothetical protein JWQ72_3945 [Polaromonas sp.]|nr:hypothetical protein [Polaromonas sp.]